MNKLWRSFQTAVHEVRILGWGYRNLHYEHYDGSHSSRFHGGVARETSTRGGGWQYRVSATWRGGWSTRYQLLKKALDLSERPSHHTKLERVGAYGPREDSKLAEMTNSKEFSPPVTSTTDESEDSIVGESLALKDFEHGSGLRSNRSIDTRSKDFRAAGVAAPATIENSTPSVRREDKEWKSTFKCPYRGRMTATLTSLMRTLSNRHARRTGKLTPLCSKASCSTVPLRSTSFAGSKSVVMHPQQPRSSESRASLMARYDNPFQEFLRRSTSVQKRFSADVVREHRFRQECWTTT